MDIVRSRPPRTRRRVIYGAVAVAALAAGTAGLGRLRGAAPTIERSMIWTETVRRGPLVREVVGQGTLQPEEIRWITAKTAARVERVLVKPGAPVQADTVLIDLANPDTELQALDAQRQLAQAEAELANLQANLTAQRLSQESVVASLSCDLGDARRRARADEDLAQKGFLSELEQGQTRDRAAELQGRVEFEKKRLAAQAQAGAAQVAAQRAQIGGLRSIAEFRGKAVDDLHVRAGLNGIVQELPLQPGQTVAVGALLAKVARPDRLKAQVRVPETQAKDLRIGLRAGIDTRNGIIPGHVSRVDPAAQGGTVLVDVSFDGAPVAGARPDLSVEGTIEIDRLPDVLFVGRPAFGQPGSPVELFKLTADGGAAVRTLVKLGRASSKYVEIVGGLAEGDRVILSDLAQWDHADRLTIR